MCTLEDKTIFIGDLVSNVWHYPMDLALAGILQVQCMLYLHKMKENIWIKNQKYEDFSLCYHVQLYICVGRILEQESQTVN